MSNWLYEVIKTDVAVKRSIRCKPILFVFTAKSILPVSNRKDFVFSLLFGKEFLVERLVVVRDRIGRNGVASFTDETFIAVRNQIGIYEFESEHRRSLSIPRDSSCHRRLS